MPTERPLLFASDCDSMRSLAKALDAELSVLPNIAAPETFEAWRAGVLSGAPRERIIVALWLDEPAQGELMSVDVDATAWRRRFELPYLLWNFALGAVGRRCADGGALVALVQTPAALDAPGWVPEFAIADGVLSLVRSVAAAEGARGVRANLVTTPIGLVEEVSVAPVPPLIGFPGTLEDQVAGALRTFLSPDASGLTGRVLSADGGRSL